MTQTKDTSKFSSKLGFILASVGSAVGMGNIWMFPYRVGKYGGAAFLIPYFIFVALFGYVGLSGEFALGRLTGTGPIGAYDYALKSRGKRGGDILGSIPLIGSLGIAIGYAIIVGWVLRFAVGAFTGTMFHQDVETYFSEITGSFGSVPWHIIVIAATVFALLAGILKGIEKASQFMMPAFFILFIIIAVRVAFLPGAVEGYKYLLVPDWSALLNPMTWVMAMGQAFFSLSITGSGMIVYGSYLSKDEDIVNSAVMTSVLDTCAALLSSFVIIPAVFAFGMDPTAGPSLMFITMPKIFDKMPMGRVFAVLFFISVLFAGVTSLINMMEAVSESLSRKTKISRVKAVVLTGIVAFAVGIFLEYDAYMGQWMDAITIYVVPIGAVIGAIIIYWVTKKEEIIGELNLGRKTELSKGFFFTAKYIYVFLAAIIVVLSIVFGGIG